MKDSVATAETERALNLGAAGEKEIQQRLRALDFYAGPETGALDPATRSALADWQKKSGFAPTSFLDSPELAALKADSETEYQKLLAAQPAAEAAASRAQRRVVVPASKPAVTRAAKPSARAKPARREVKRSNPKRTQTAEEAAPAPPPVFVGGSPAWRHAAGLPELPSDPGMGGRPPGFWLGTTGGLLLRAYRH